MQLRLVLLVAAVLALAQSVSAQSASVQSNIGVVDRTFRGAVGRNHIQMSLIFKGNNVSGKYSYDRVGEEITVKGMLDADRKLELVEFGAKNKPTGRFRCKRPFDDPIDRDCYWSKPDGSSESFVSLNEQFVALRNGLQIRPQVITDRAKGVVVSYPQLESSGVLSPGAQKFNRRILAMTQKAIADFQPVDGKGSFDSNYTVLLGTNDLISIEMMEYSDGGGAHPNDRWWALTYDLAANKELKFADLFKPDSDYSNALAKYITADIDRRADELEKESARGEKRTPNKRDDSIVPMEQLSEVSDFALTPKGIVIYFDFPHVIAVFDRNFVPYSVVREYLNPNGAAARFQ